MEARAKCCKLFILRRLCMAYGASMELLVRTFPSKRLAVALLPLRLSAKAALLTLRIFAVANESYRAAGVGVDPGAEWYARQDSNL